MLRVSEATRREMQRRRPTPFGEHAYVRCGRPQLLEPPRAVDPRLEVMPPMKRSIACSCRSGHSEINGERNSTTISP